jgi:flagellar P-ring protein precursor FlgI
VAPKVVSPPVAPGSLTGGQTVVVRQDQLKVKESGGQLVTIPDQTTLDDLVKALNALGVKPRDLIAILQALKEAGALQAELVLL